MFLCLHVDSSLLNRKCKELTIWNFSMCSNIQKIWELAKAFLEQLRMEKLSSQISYESCDKKTKTPRKLCRKMCRVLKLHLVIVHAFVCICVFMNFCIRVLCLRERDID